MSNELYIDIGYSLYIEPFGPMREVKVLENTSLQNSHCQCLDKWVSLHKVYFSNLVNTHNKRTFNKVRSQPMHTKFAQY